jgi:Ca2+-binding RTX toxin-like protein
VANISGFEVLQATTNDGTDYDASNISGLTKLIASATSGANDVTFVNVPSTVTDIQVTGTEGVIATLKTDTANDSVTVTYGSSTAGVAVADQTELNDYENITLVSQGSANTVSPTGSTSFKANDLTTLTITGSMALTLGSMDTGNTLISKIDASALTSSTAHFIMTDNASTTASTILGGAGNDVLYGGTKADSITGNDGADTLFGGDGNDTISGGSGADSISGGSGTDVLTGGDGNDTFYVGTASDFATAETVDGGSGTDTLSFADVATSLAAADVLGLKSIEKITYAAATSNTTALTLTDAVFTANGNTTLTIDASAATSGAVTLAASGLTAANSLYIDVSNSSNAGTNSVVLGAGNDTVKIDDTALDTSGATYTAGSGTDTLLVQTGGTVPGSAISLVSGITGFETISFGTAIDDYSLVADSATVASGATLTVDGSTLTTGKLYYDASSETNGKYSINGGNAADTLIGGQGNDTIAGGSGADSISGNAGVDNLSGGAGDDVFYVTTANHFTSLSAAETVSGGAGNDTLQFADATLAVGATDLSAINSIETIKFLGTTNTSSLTLTDAVFTADGNTTLTVNAAAATSGAVTVSASGLSAANSLVVDMSNASNTATNNISLGAGNDTLTVDADTLDNTSSALSGGSGTDTLKIETGGTATFVSGLTGFEKISFGTAANNYTLTADAATVASGATLTVDGSTLTSGTLAYNASAETDGLYILNGGGGADSLVGGQKNDTLSGGSGADILQGGSGTDSLTGGAGADTFVFGTAAESGGANVDSITDFVSGTDKLQFTLNYSSQSAGLTVDATLLSAGTGVAGLSAAQTALSGNRGQMVYDTTNSVLYVNNTNDNLITSLDYTIAINPASTAGNTVAAADINTSITGGSGADSIVGGAGADTISGGVGQDTISGGLGGDTIDVGSEAAVVDTVVIAAGDTSLTISGTGNSGTISGFDTVSNFAAGDGTNNSDALNVPGTAAIATATVGTDGTDSTLTIGGVTVKSHAIAATGEVTFDDANTFASALTLSATTDVAAVVQYLQSQDLGGIGNSVWFDVGSDDYVYTQGSANGSNNTLDTLVKLVGVQADTFITTNGSGSNDLYIL